MSRTDENLVLHLSELFELRINVSDLKKCDPDLIQKIYLHFAKDMGVNLEQINEIPPFGISDMEQYPDMYRSVMHIKMLAEIMRSLMHQLFHDASFQPADLYDTKSKRTKHFLWMICEFYSVISGRDQQFSDIEEEVGIKRDKAHEMEEKIQHKQMKVNQLRCEKAEYKLQQETEENRVAAEREKLEQTQAKKVKLRSEQEELQLKTSTFNTKIKEAEIRCIQRCERIKELEGQVVQESEKVAINQRESRVEQLRNSVAEKKDHLSQAQQSLNTLEQDLDNMTLLLASIQDVARTVSKAKESQGVVAKLERDMIAIQEDKDDKAMEKNDYNERLETQQTNIARNQQTWKLTKQSMQEEAKQHKQTLEEIQRKKTEHEIACQAMEEELNADINLYSEQVVAIDNFYAGQYKTIIDAMVHKNNSLEAVLPDLIPDTYRLERLKTIKYNLSLRMVVGIQ